MVRLSRSPALVRAVFAAALGMLIGLRLLMPVGFMPAFDRGAVTIVACPDASPPIHGMEHRKSEQAAHQPCPYSAAASLDGITPASPLLAALILFGFAYLPGRAFAFIERHCRRERPPVRGPPIPA